MDNLYGIAAINANNGWAISVVGISIVFSGLVILSLVISQLHKVLALWENPEKIKAIFSRPEPEDGSPQDLEEALPAPISREQIEIIKQLSLLVRTMADHFSLPRLLHLAQVSGIKNPHASISALIKRRIIFPDGEGFFCWDHDLFNKTVSQ